MDLLVEAELRRPADRPGCPLCRLGEEAAVRYLRSVLHEGMNDDEGRDLTMIREFTATTRGYWAGTVCGRCSGNQTPSRCRPHLLGEVRSGGAVDLASHRDRLADILERLTVYARSFRWECRDTATDRDRAALLSAVGWCSGWEGGLALLGDSA